MPIPRYFTAQEAARELGIRLPTLYAYVSRGLIRSEATGESKRVRRYRADDVRKLKARKEDRQDPARAVESALHWGAPLMESAITLIADGRFYYRGRDALALAREWSVEQVAGLLWLADLPAEDKDVARFQLPERCRAILPQVIGLTPLDAYLVMLPLAATGDLAAYDLRPQAVAQTGARILGLLTTISVGEQGEAAGIARKLQRGWVPGDASAAELLNTALILCADHELNVSSFTARCVASAGSTPYAVVMAGLAALQGTRHGGYTERVEALLQEIREVDQVRPVLAGRLRRGEAIPGFGHVLYPEGDPRARELLACIQRAYPLAPEVALAASIVQNVRDLMGEYPTVDFGLVILAHTLGLPPGGAIALFALGRTIGWIGHAIEQYESGRLIRPRARYVGGQPES
jgi:citrate synthase